MREYEYVSVDYKKREVIMVGFGISEHREIIDDYAARGYRYVGSIITEVDSNARIRKSTWSSRKTRRGGATPDKPASARQGARR